MHLCVLWMTFYQFMDSLGIKRIVPTVSATREYIKHVVKTQQIYKSSAKENENNIAIN